MEANLVLEELKASGLAKRKPDAMMELAASIRLLVSASLNQRPPEVKVEAPAVSVAPAVVNIPEQKFPVYIFTVKRDNRGNIQEIVAKPQGV